MSERTPRERRSGEDQAISVTQVASLFQDGQSPAGKRHAVWFTGLHPLRGYGPRRLLQVHLIPGHAPDLAGSAGRQRQHLETQLDRRAGR